MRKGVVVCGANGERGVFMEEAWQQGRGLPMQFGKVEAKSTLVVEPE